MNTTRKITLSLIAVLTLFFATSCKDDENPDLLPVLTSKLVSVNYKAANIQGNIATVTGLKVIDRGVCWSKRKMPTIDSTKMSAGQGVGSFTCSLVGLTPDSVYYVRAYATSKAGTTYGNQVSFKAPVMIRFNPSVSYDTLIDIDGNKYRIDTIGTQIWMCENLRVTKYRDGSPIANLTSNSDWIAATTGAYCHYNNNSEFVLQRGVLYNWYAATDSKNIAPEGWHVATDADWQVLSTFCKGNGGWFLKEEGNDNWQNSTMAINFYGFTAIPGGYRSYFNGSFYFYGQNGYWWTATEQNATNAISNSMSNKNDKIDKSNSSKADGYSIRCVKD